MQLRTGTSLCGVLYLTAAVLLGGCGTPGAVSTAGVLPTAAPVASPPSFLYQDRRPPAEKVSRQDASPNGTTVFLGDNSLNPTGAALVQQALHRTLNAQLAGKTIVLTDFTVYVYDPAATVNASGMPAARWEVPSGSAMTPLAALFTTSVGSLVSEKTVRAIIQGTVDGSAFSVNLADRYRGRVSDERVLALLSKALDQVVHEVEHMAAVK